MSDATINPPPDAPPDGLAGGDAGGPPGLSIADEMKDSFLNYAMSVIISRALPDVRDGLKPSQRRILVAMNGLGLGPTASTSKCAGIIGETMGRYHPHGDASIYATLVRLAQNWNMRYPLVHPQGNFSSQAGLPPAAYRYTEARLSHIGAEMLADLEYDTVDFSSTYDGKNREPNVLPSKFPNLLVNGSDGIAVGMTTDIPPHNLGEVCDALIKIIDDPEVTLVELMQIIPGPDFPTGNIICGRQGILDGYATGRGRITLRARADIVEDKKDTQIIIREIPYQQTRIRLAEAIGKLVNEGRIADIREIRDESSSRGGEPVRVVLYLKRGADPNLILNQLYQYSPLEQTTSIIMLALVDNHPRTLTLKELLTHYLRHRKEVVRRRAEYLLREAQRRSHILEGQLIAISSLDEVIRICREAASREEAKQQLQGMAVSAALMERALGESNFLALVAEIGQSPTYHMTDAQSEAVVRMQLGQLARLQRDEILKEYADLRVKVRAFVELLSSEQNMLDVIKAELGEMRDKYGDDRRTEITGEAANLSIDDLIAEEEQIVTLSHKGYIKRLPLTTYRSQRRGGRGVSGGATREDDFIEHFYAASTHAYLLCFTNRGQLYWLRVYSIPEGSRTSAGRHINQVLQFKQDERITSVIPVRHLDASVSDAGGLHLMMATRSGIVKKTALSDYCRPKSGGIIGISLDEGDTLIGVALVRPGDEVMLCTKTGMSIRFDEHDARPMGRNTRGVRGIRLLKDDEVVGMVVADPEGYLLTVCANGYGKRTPFGPNTALLSEEADGEAPEEVEEEAPEPAAEEGDGETEGEARKSNMSYRKQRRGGKGVRDVRTSDRNGPVVCVTAVNEADDVMLITTGGMVNRTRAGEIRVVGRNTQGVKLMNVHEGDKLVSLARVGAEEMVEAGEG